MDMNFDGFDAVWNRVTGSSSTPDEAFDDEKSLRFFMDKEAEASATYNALARRCTSRKTAIIFTNIARDEQHHLKELQSAYFLLCGDSYCPKTPQIKYHGMLTALREQYKSEVQSAEGYETASGKTRIPNLSRIFKSISAEERHHIKIIEDLIGKALG